MTRYEQGFLKKCASFGIDGRRLLKQALSGGALAGAGLGAVSGGLFGALASEKKNRLRNAILGAIAGGGIGFAGGSAVANGARADMMERQLGKERVSSERQLGKERVSAARSRRAAIEANEKLNMMERQLGRERVSEARKRRRLMELPDRRLHQIAAGEKDLENKRKLFNIDSDALRRAYRGDYASLDAYGLERIKNILPPDLYDKAIAELDRRNLRVDSILNEVQKEYELMQQKRQEAEERVRKLRPSRAELIQPRMKP